MDPEAIPARFIAADHGRVGIQAKRFLRGLDFLLQLAEIASIERANAGHAPELIGEAKFPFSGGKFDGHVQSGHGIVNL